MLAWSQLSGVGLRPHEYELIRRIDSEYLRSQQPPPTEDKTPQPGKRRSSKGQRA